MKAGGITHKIAFEEMRNFLAGQHVGATRDEALLDEVVKCLFARAWMQRKAPQGVLGSQSREELVRAYDRAFREIRRKLPRVFANGDDSLNVNAVSLEFINSRLGEAQTQRTDIDPLGDAYQTFIGSAIRGSEGQFFTPPAAVAWLVEAVAPKEGEKIIDPACGTGSFLSYAARYLMANGSSPEKHAQNLFGIEKDQYLARLATQHIALSTLSLPSIICGDSIGMVDVQSNPLVASDYLNAFDVVLSNPPFGVQIVSAAEDTLRQFDLAHKWLKQKNGKFTKTDTIAPRTPPQILFVERILSLLRPGGRAGLVLPESSLSSPKYAFAVQYIRDRANISAVIGMPESLFKTSGKGGTHTKTCLLILTKKEAHSTARQHQGRIFLAEARWCGHDSRGNEIPRDDLPTILATYLASSLGKTSASQQLGWWIDGGKVETNILAPHFYERPSSGGVESLGATHDLVTFGSLVDRGILSYTTGVEVGKLAYGGGAVPFVRTSDLSNWEIKIDPKQCVSEAVYLKYQQKLDVRDNDILMVKDGTYLIGTCAIVTRHDTQIVFQSHLYKIRVENQKAISPHLLLAILSSEPVQQQIRNKRLSQDIIDSLGSRIRDLVLPIPKQRTLRNKIERLVKKVVDERIEARELARKARLLVVGG